MPSFTFRAVDQAGTHHAGRTRADSAAGAAEVLAGRGLTVVDVAEVADPVGRRTGRTMLAEATRNLASLLTAGLPLPRALSSAALAAGPLADVLDDVRSRVERGDAVAAALAEHPAQFDAVYVGVVRAGERTGDLAGAFERLAAQLDREVELRARLLTALVYPAILGAFGGAALLILLFAVLPRFAVLLEGTGAALPRSTALLLAVAAGMRAHWPWLMGGVLALVGAVAMARPGGPLAALGARALLALPLVGSMRRELLSARVARLASLLLQGGTPLVPALEIAERSVGDVVARDGVATLHARVREGTPLHAALGASTLWAPVLAELARVGEASGRLGDFLGRAAELLERRGDRALTRLVALVQPLVIVLFGGIVGLVALSLLQAVYGLNAGALR